jgi:hypothetical protein
MVKLCILCIDLLGDKCSNTAVLEEHEKKEE